MGAVRGRPRPAARFHGPALVRPRRLLGRSAYVTGLVAIHSGVPFPVAVLAGAVFAMVLARADRLPVGATHRHLLRDGHPGVRADGLLRRQPVARRHRRRERPPGGAEGRSSASSGRDRPVLLLLRRAAHRARRACGRPGAIVHSPFGRVLVAIRDNAGPGPGSRLRRREATRSSPSCSPPGLAGLAGGVFAISHGFASLRRAALDDLRRGRAGDGPRRDRHAVGRRRGRRRGRDRGRAGVVRLRRRSASSPARSSSSSCCCSGAGSGARPGT